MTKREEYIRFENQRFSSIPVDSQPTEPGRSTSEAAPLFPAAFLAECKRAMLDRMAEIELRNRETPTIERVAEEEEQAMLCAENGFVAGRLNSDREVSRQIAAALRRMKAGEYGICLECEEPMKEKRLRAVPWAQYCVPCQEQKDAEARQDVDLVFAGAEA